MKRVNIITRLRLLRIANSAISKLNSEKNRTKPDWHEQSFGSLCYHLGKENMELFEAVYTVKCDFEHVIDECKDNINLPLMIADNAKRQLRKERREKNESRNR